MGQQYTYSKIWVENIMAIIHISGDSAIVLLFCDHQDTEYESREINIREPGPIFIQKISKPLWYNNIHIPQYG